MKEIELFHDPGKREGAESSHKKLYLSPGQQYGFMLTLVEEDNRVTIPISDDEAVILGTLFQATIPMILKWHE